MESRSGSTNERPSGRFEAESRINGADRVRLDVREHPSWSPSFDRDSFAFQDQVAGSNFGLVSEDRTAVPVFVVGSLFGILPVPTEDHRSSRVPDDDGSSGRHELRIANSSTGVVTISED